MAGEGNKTNSQLGEGTVKASFNGKLRKPQHLHAPAGRRRGGNARPGPEERRRCVPPPAPPRALSAILVKGNACPLPGMSEEAGVTGLPPRAKMSASSRSFPSSSRNPALLLRLAAMVREATQARRGGGGR